MASASRAFSCKARRKLSFGQFRVAEAGVDQPAQVEGRCLVRIVRNGLLQFVECGFELPAAEVRGGQFEPEARPLGRIGLVDRTR